VKQDNVHMNTESVQCISTVYSSLYVQLLILRICTIVFKLCRRFLSFLFQFLKTVV